jgi:hypothetical protein
MSNDKTVVNQVDDEVVVEEQNVTVPLQDVKLILSVIDVVAKRGGFSPMDFKAVGDLFEKLSVHVKK